VAANAACVSGQADDGGGPSATSEYQTAPENLAPSKRPTLTVCPTSNGEISSVGSSVSMRGPHDRVFVPDAQGRAESPA
jgi:hypothetical protein